MFTPARYDGLPGWSFPARGWSYPTKDEVADYLEAYAARFELPVRTGVRVDGLSRQDGRYVVTAGRSRYHANSVVVASGGYQAPRIPAFASELDPEPGLYFVGLFFLYAGSSSLIGGVGRDAKHVARQIGSPRAQGGVDKAVAISPQIEHRLFSHISMNWRGRPLTSHDVIVQSIAATTTRTGSLSTPNSTPTGLPQMMSTRLMGTRR